MPRFRVGQSAQYVRKIREEDVHLCAQLTGDTNPLHLDEAFAQQTRFRGRIVHGVLLLGYISAVLGTQLPGPGAVYLEQQVRFRHPARIGDIVIAEVTVQRWDAERRRLYVQTRAYNQKQVLLLDGQAVLLVE